MSQKASLGKMGKHRDWVCRQCGRKKAPPAGQLGEVLCPFCNLEQEDANKAAQRAEGAVTYDIDEAKANPSKVWGGP
ncbi:MAG: hypothetical protein ACHQC8_06550 [Solirubrobacterales bacterium]